MSSVEPISSKAKKVYTYKNTFATLGIKGKRKQ